MRFQPKKLTLAIVLAIFIASLNAQMDNFKIKVDTVNFWKTGDFNSTSFMETNLNVIYSPEKK